MKNFEIDNYIFSQVDENEYEGKLVVWGKETTIFVDMDEDVEDVVSLVKEKIQWINDNKQGILDSFMLENDHYVDVVNEAIEKGDFKADSPVTYEDFMDALFINNVAIILSDLSLMIDLDANPDYLFGHLAAMEVDSEYNVEFSGLNG